MPESIIHFNSPLEQYLPFAAEIQKAICRVLSSGKYILGSEVNNFEHNLKQYTNTKYAIGVASGTDAIYLALKALNIGDGDEVITVANTALATIAAIVQAGATPVLVDVEPEYYTIHPKLLKHAISKKTKAILVVHLYGQAADMLEINHIANAYGLPVIEDCAQAIGARYNAQAVGSLATLGCFSFYPTKNLGAIGDGGAVTTNDQELASKILSIRQYGWNKHRVSISPGINSRLDELQAAILNIKIQHLDNFNQQRKNIALTYANAFKNIRKLTPPKIRANSEHVFHLYVIQSPYRDQLAQTLKEHNIETAIHYPQAIYQHPGFKKHIRISQQELPVTEKLLSNILSLPLYPGLNKMQQATIIEILSQQLEQLL